MKPKVSVVIPAYNAARFLRTSIGSIQQQPFEDWECLVIDDGSTDDTRELIASLASDDSRIRYCRKENDGQRSLSTTRNFGIERARGEWIQLLDADDWLLPDKLAAQMKRTESAPHPSNTVFYCDYEVVWEDPNGQVNRRSEVIVGDLDPEEMLARIMTWHRDPNMPLHVNSTLFHRDVLQRRRFDENLRGFEEIELFVSLILLGVNFIYTPTVGMAYRRHDTNVTHDERRFVIGYLHFLRAIHGRRPDLARMSPKMGSLFQRALIEKDSEILDEIVETVRQTKVPVRLSRLEMDFSNPTLLRVMCALRPIIPFGRLFRIIERRRTAPTST